jgi:predicted nucleic acid-binding protein
MRRARKGRTRFYWDTCCFVALLERKQTVTTVHELARDLRSRCRQAGVHTPKTPDALHLAAGILSKCDEFWTLDKRLLNSGAVITEIAIRLPHVEQLKLEF